MSKPFRDIILAPVVTEKATDLLGDNKYVFRVRKDANKIEIRKAVESRFGVTVASVRTMRVKGKARTFRGQTVGRTASWKKAVVKLRAGQNIEELGV